MTDIGDRIQAYRKRVGLTLRELADKSGLSPSFISKLEAGKVGISVASLDKLSDSLGVEMANLLFEASNDVPMLSQKDFRSRIQLEGNSFYEQITPKQPDFCLSAGIVVTDVGGVSGEATTHEGDEIHFILKGKFKFMINNEEFILEEGDCISHHSQDPHAWENIGEGQGMFLVVSSLPITYNKKVS